MKKKVVELFAGVGGFRVGLNKVTAINKNGKAIENGDWDFVWANQWEPSTKAQHAFDCYTKRFGNDCSNLDISLVDKNNIPNHSLLVGGFPCQDYSVARSLSKEKGIEGKKGVLFWEIAKVLEAKKTPFFLLENVDRLLKSPSTQRGRDFGIMLRTLYDLGYNIEWRIINAADYGAPQRRRRIFIFGWLKSTKYNQSLLSISNLDLITTGFFSSIFPVQPLTEPACENDLTQYQDTVEMTQEYRFTFQNTGIMKDGLVTTVKTEPIYETPIPLSAIRETTKDLSKYILPEDKLSKVEFLRGAKKIERKSPDGRIYYYSEGAMSPFDSLELPGRTMLTSEGSMNRSSHFIPDYHTGKLRKLTPIEAERLQCFPDNWTNTGMPESKRYFMMGNALVTMLISRMEPKLNEIITNE